MSVVKEQVEISTEDELRTTLVAEVTKLEKSRKAEKDAKANKDTASTTIIKTVLDAEGTEYNSIQVIIERFREDKKKGWYDKYVNVVRPKASGVLNMDKLKERLGSKKFKGCHVNQIAVEVKDQETFDAIVKYLDRHRAEITSQTIRENVFSTNVLETLQKTGAADQNIIEECTDVEYGKWKINGACPEKHESVRLKLQQEAAEKEELDTLTRIL